jgi:hypothetical protein
MKRHLEMLVTTLALLLPAAAFASVGITVHIGDAPPPPVIVVREPPRVVYVPSARVYVVDDDAWAYDGFHVGSYWYVYEDGWWYRSRTWRGPYAVIETRYVPARIHDVPVRYWRRGHPHGGPPGQMKKAYGGSDASYKDHGNGNGHGNGHGKDH